MKPESDWTLQPFPPKPLTGADGIGLSVLRIRNARHTSQINGGIPHGNTHGDP